ncbi:MAG: AAA family ATPase [Candidatus Omnitrophica bacterium]|nr:AAA family ATPase [Candidatus Omnitrophota bacterium]
MISIESVVIKEFRGIRDLTLNFKEKNFAICGPNGTGKSGVVDALEFVLTGNISRLSGEGRGDISLRQHGPHVDKRNDPAKARVIVKVKIHSLNKEVTIERTLKKPTNAFVTPNEPAIIAILQKVESHPEIMLSRRELIRYVLATPGKRAEEVQALLHLEQIEKVRTGLQKIANSCEKQLIPTNAIVSSTRANLLRALGISDLTKENVLAVVNKQRLVLGLPELSELNKTTSLKDGMAAPIPAQPQRIPKVQAIADIKAARDAIMELTGVLTTGRANEVKNELIALNNDPSIMASVKRETLYTTGLELIENEACPFCDTSWNLDELKKHVQAKVDHLKEISRKRKTAEIKLVPLIVTIRKVQSAINALIGYAVLVTPPIAIDDARDYVAQCKIYIDSISAFLPLSETISNLSKLVIVPETVINTINQLEKEIIVLPEPSKQDAAREWLTVAQERFEVFLEAKQKQKIAKDQAEKARQISDIYAKTSDEVLTCIYAAVEKDFIALYALLHQGDEEEFKAKLTPSLGKLGFDVDFYGRGFFPPGAYHSEGHQDSMGLCLYLALMRHLQGNAFTFAVLDDVLMSVDVGHRRQVCALLKKEFSNTQFIMTTHDPVWLRHMRTEKIISGKSAMQFRSWNIEHGPTQWDERDIWAEIDDHLKSNSVHVAAGLLRHYLEYIAAELCHRLHALVKFRGDSQYQLGELLPSAITQLRKLYKNAKMAASSWNQKDILDQVAERESQFANLANACKAEEWQVNTAIHYNSWENLAKSEFEPVVRAFQELLNGFICQHCGEYFYVSPDRETPESLRCDCGKTSINLCEKK